MWREEARAAYYQLHGEDFKKELIHGLRGFKGSMIQVVK